MKRVIKFTKSFVINTTVMTKIRQIANKKTGGNLSQAVRDAVHYAHDNLDDITTGRE